MCWVSLCSIDNRMKCCGNQQQQPYGTGVFVVHPCSLSGPVTVTRLIQSPGVGRYVRPTHLPSIFLAAAVAAAAHSAHDDSIIVELSVSCRYNPARLASRTVGSSCRSTTVFQSARIHDILTGVSTEAVVTCRSISLSPVEPNTPRI